MSNRSTPQVVMIPIDRIQVMNPRDRNKRKHRQITESIDTLGLKRPITVSRQKGKEDRYDLVCGQGRLESFIALGQKEVPAFVVDVSKEERLLMSLAENISRRRYSSTELLREIVNLKERGYTPTEMAKKTGLAKGYISDILHLFDKGEEYLISAVEKGKVPIHAALTIANASDKELQKVLQEAYETKKIPSRQLHNVRLLVERRSLYGKKVMPSRRRKGDIPKTTEGLVNAYRKEVQRQQLLIKKANLAERRLLFIVSMLKTCCEDENFINLLRAERLDTMPKFLGERIRGQRATT